MITVFVSDVTNSGSITALEKTLAFVEARNRMLSENIANITTPGYRTKQLDVSAFRAALKEASGRREESGGELELSSTEQFQTDSAGMLNVTPTEEPAENLSFQDGTNARIERQMALLGENTLMGRVVTDLLRFNLDLVDSAVRGRVR